MAALRLAWDAAVAGVPLVEHARQHPALRRTGSEHADRNGLEIVLKGGQMGSANFFGLARRGPSQ